jgi:hypothetical protein
MQFKRVIEKTNFRSINAMDWPRKCARKKRIAFGQRILW